VLYEGSSTGGAWHKVTIGSGLVPACLDGGTHQAGGDEPGLIAPGADSLLYLVCQSATTGSGGPEPVLYRSADSGQTWQLVGKVRSRGAATSMAVAPDSGTIVVATSDGIDYSRNGRSWQQAIGSPRAPTFGFDFVGMTTQREGVAVPADALVNELFFTTDGGKTWRARRI
jgi:hypothetical protein